MDSASYLTGLICGVVATAILAFILNQMRDQRRLMGGKDQSLDSFPDKKQSDMTANGIVRSSRNATFSYVIWMFALIVVLIVSCAGLTFILRP